jgi:hypothetical protein
VKHILFIFAFLSSCASARYIGTQPGEPGSRLTVIAGDVDISFVTFDNVSVSDSTRTIYTEPGSHKASFRYQSRRLYSVQNAEIEFSGNRGDTVMACYTSVIRSGSYPNFDWRWGIFPLVYPGQVDATSLFVKGENPTCLLWSGIGRESIFMQENIDQGARRDFKNLKGQTLLQFAKSIGAPSENIARLEKNGFK